MPKISLLEKNIAELIAAGEVIDRPASVIKETAENAIDAGAHVITVEIKNGGISYMRITDDGCGISREDVRTAFLRYATSKIKGEDDLVRISTMGFRGEALPSIAVVSRVELLSKQKDSVYGTLYKIEGGTETEMTETGCPDGTTLIIRDLFYNTPARLKFLKKDVSEGNAVAGVIDKLALSHPGISFRFIRDNKLVRITAGDGKPYAAVYSVFGKWFAAELINVDYSYNGTKVTGFVSSPLFPRGNRSMQYFYVNGRYINSRHCAAALEEAYRGSIMTGKFPSCIINIEIDYSEVDVNVHPAKTEIRFSNERLIFDTVYYAVKNAILNAENIKESELLSGDDKRKDDNKDDDIEKEKNRLSSFKFTPDYTKKENTLKIDVTPKKVTYQPRLSIEKSFSYINEESLIKKETPQNENMGAPNTESEDKTEAPLKIIGELWKTYIICEHCDNVILIDKHAAHERLRYEKLRGELSSASQLLAESVCIKMDLSLHEKIVENREKLLEIGIEALDGGNYTIEVTAVPSILYGGKNDIENLMNEIGEIYIKGGEDEGSIFDKVLSSIACRSAIKANDKNDIGDLTLLAETVWNNKNIRFCPHGRPIITKINKKEIEKDFKRIV